MGAHVTVAARSDSALAAAECDGHRPVSISSMLDSFHECGVCFNTVPMQIFDVEDVRKWSCPLFIELASLPGGFTEEAKKHLSVRYISALSLPGRYFPITAGEIIYKTVLTMIRQGEIK